MSASLYRGTGVILVASATTTTSTNSGILAGTNVFPAGSAISMFLDVTANAGDAAGTSGVQVYLDTSPDGGTTWMAVEKFARVISSTGTQMINFRSTGLGAVEAAAQSWILSTTTSVAVANNVVLSPTNRIRWELGSNTGATVAVTSTFSVTANVQPMGSTIG